MVPLVLLAGSRVLLGGSRALPPAGLSLARALGADLAFQRLVLHVGCAPGADEAAFAGFSSVGGSAVVFAVGGPSSGFPAGAPPAWIARASATPGVSVRWWAGGPPAVPLRARLARRSRAALVGADAAAWVVSSPASRGSLRAAAAAAAAGIPVFVFPVGFSPAALPALGAGRWVAAVFLDRSAARWLPAQLSFL